MKDKKKKSVKPKKPEKPKIQKENQEDDNPYGGLPDMDFKKTLGCGG